MTTSDKNHDDWVHPVGPGCDHPAAWLNWSLTTPGGAGLNVEFYGRTDRVDIEFIRRSMTIIQETIAALLVESPKQQELDTK